MRTVICLVLFILAGFAKASAQVRCEAYLPGLFIEVDSKAGPVNQSFTSAPVAANYPSAVNATQGKMNFTNARSLSEAITLGYYINKKRTFGFATGLIFSRGTSDLDLTSFHVEYSATDFKGNVFRQSVTATHSIQEAINMQSINIPFLLKYKKDLSRKSFLTVDAGIVYSVQQNNTYNTNANFDYEAVYKFAGTGDNVTTVYENSVTPGANDWVITKNEVLKNNPNENVQNYFTEKNNAGYSVGLGEKVNKNTGSFKFGSGSLGYTTSAAINIKLVKKVFLKLGCYYLAQSLQGAGRENLLLTQHIVRNAAGQDIGVDYNPLISSIKTLQNNTYGINIGITVFLSSHSLWDFE